MKLANKFLMGLVFFGVGAYSNIDSTKHKQEPKQAVASYDTLVNKLNEKNIIEIVTEYEVMRMGFSPIPVNSGGILRELHLLGNTNFDDKRIMLNKIYPINIRRFTLLHELYHIVADHYGVDLTEDQVNDLAWKKYKTLYPDSTK